jgi:hypothetical protein
VYIQKHAARLCFTSRTANPTLDENTMKRLFTQICAGAALFGASALFVASAAFSQAEQEKPREKEPAKIDEKAAEPPNAAQIELLETKYRFESSGDSRKQVHALVKINSELGVRQFARLNFDYNRGFQSVEISLVHIAHPSGGTADILPSAITDVPNPAVEKFPEYQDVRIKSVRILGLQPGDTLEYRVSTTTSHAPLAPDFWLSHSFDRTGVVQTEDFLLDLPDGVTAHIDPETPADSVEKSSDGSRSTYHWRRTQKNNLPAAETEAAPRPDISLSTLDDWGMLSDKLAKLLYPRTVPGPALQTKADELTAQGKDPGERIRAIYKFVSQKIVTVDLPLGSAGYRARDPQQILASGYATPEDKATLFSALARAVTVEPYLHFTFPQAETSPAAVPAQFERLVLGVFLQSGKMTMLDPALEVAPFGMISAKFRGRHAFCATEPAPHGAPAVEILPKLPGELPFTATQSVDTASTLGATGTLSTKVKYRLRGDNELLLRVTFHKAPAQKQKEIAQYLALSDGFRGKVTSVKTSDPYETDQPFEVEYELTQEKFVDWSKKHVRVPALLPLPGLPDAPKKSAAESTITLGPPLKIDLSGTLRLPAGITAEAPPGTSVKRDYATFSSEYSAKENVLRFARKLNFLAPDLPAARAVDLNAFLHAVQSDQSVLFVLAKPEAAAAKPK